jgi:hypothetical protein
LRGFLVADHEHDFDAKLQLLWLRYSRSGVPFHFLPGRQIGKHCCSLLCDPCWFPGTHRILRYRFRSVRYTSAVTLRFLLSWSPWRLTSWCAWSVAHRSLDLAICRSNEACWFPRRRVVRLFASSRWSEVALNPPPTRAISSTPSPSSPTSRLRPL